MPVQLTSPSGVANPQGTPCDVPAIVRRVPAQWVRPWGPCLVFLASWMAIGLVTLLVSGPASAVVGPALTAEEVADRVQATYQSFSDLQAAFVQKATNRLSGVSQEASGRLFLKWPGKMRWEYEKPEPRLFLIDGKILWSYSPTERQAVAQELGGALSTGPIGILFGVSSLRRDFRVRTIRHAGTRDSQEYLLDLAPKAEDLSFKRVVLAIDRESFLIQRITVFDLYGNTTSVDLSDLKVNGGLKEGLFQFSPPPGTDVVTPPKSPGR